ncbi:MAG: FimB/Mfa2 family fimbrial subunit [Candidatus Azobacteroides sp.]|nr:FimB/Mfa2 family fimbrial subunit [Candidatus Azobacteroides sp.]
MNLFRQILSLLPFLVLTVTTSCIRENNDCPPGNSEVKVYFSYPLTGNERNETILPAEQIDLYIFNEQGKFVKSHTDPSPVLTPGYYINIILDPGTYTLISWVNLKECYGLSHEEITEETLLEELLVHLQTDENDTINTQIHPLYFGNLSGQQIHINQEHVLTIPLVRNTYNIHVTTEGLEQDATHDYHLIITDRNGSYTFDNSFASDKEVHYKSACLKNDNNQPYGSLSVLRLHEDRKHAILKLQNSTTHEILYECNLLETILSLRDQGITVDFSTTFDYNIHLSFQADMSVDITINDWKITEDQEELR